MNSNRLKEISLILEEIENDRDAGSKGYTIEELDRIPDEAIENGGRT